jgi:hypothetical protein
MVKMLLDGSGLTLPLLKDAQFAEGTGVDERLIIEEGISRARLKNSIALQELDEVIFALKRDSVGYLLGGSLSIQLAVSSEYVDCFPAEEVEVWVRPEKMSDALRALGKSGYRLIDEISQSGIGAVVELQKEEGATTVRVRRNFETNLPAYLGSVLWDYRSNQRLSTTDWAIDQMLIFCGESGPQGLAALYSLKTVLKSEIGTEIDWLRLAKTLGTAQQLGSAVAGFAILSNVWGATLREPIQSLVEKRSKGMSGEILRAWYTPAQLIEHRGLSGVKRLLSTLTALRTPKIDGSYENLREKLLSLDE